MIFLIAGILGVIAGIIVPYNLNSTTLPYAAVAIIAALDSVFGAWHANLNKKFNLNVFMMGLVSNAVLAVALTFVGNLLGINLYFAAIIVFGVRMFNNMSSIRRLTLDIYFEKRARDIERLKRRALKAAEGPVESGTEIKTAETEEEVTQEQKKNPDDKK